MALEISSRILAQLPAIRGMRLPLRVSRRRQPESPLPSIELQLERSTGRRSLPELVNAFFGTRAKNGSDYLPQQSVIVS